MCCPYCGAQYEKEYQGMPVKFVVERPGVHRIRAEVRIDDSMKVVNPEIATEAAMHKLRQGLADGLLDYMKCVVQHNPMSMYQIIRGEVRVVDPTFDY